MLGIVREEPERTLPPLLQQISGHPRVGVKRKEPGPEPQRSAAELMLPSPSIPKLSQAQCWIKVLTVWGKTNTLYFSGKKCLFEVHIAHKF